VHSLIITDKIAEKLWSKHGVMRADVEQCFANRQGGLLEDTREGHRTDPPTWWFISETDRGRRLKIVFIERDGSYYIKTAYDANDAEEQLYERYG
jgi:hypothetical protein